MEVAALPGDPLRRRRQHAARAGPDPVGQQRIIGRSGRQHALRRADDDHALDGGAVAVGDRPDVDPDPDLAHPVRSVGQLQLEQLPQRPEIPLAGQAGQPVEGRCHPPGGAVVLRGQPVVLRRGQEHLPQPPGGSRHLRPRGGTGECIEASVEVVDEPDEAAGGVGRCAVAFGALVGVAEESVPVLGFDHPRGAGHPLPA